MSLEITGKLYEKYDTQQVSEKFKKRDFVLETTEDIGGKTYTNYGKFQLTQAKCDIIDRANVGDMIKVSFNIKGNKWERDGKVNFITNLDAWRVELVTAGSGGPTAPQHAAAPPPENIDNLPF